MKLNMHLPSGRTLSADVSDTEIEGAHAWFDRLNAPASALVTGQTVEVELDWATLRLKAQGKEVQVFEPDYSAPDAVRFVPGVATTDQVFAAQERLMRALDLVPQPVHGQQYVRVAESALNSTSVFGHRFAETESEFTGWQIGSSAPAEGESFGQYSVRELTHRNLAWLVAMCLPTGWSFRFAGHTLIDCVAASGQTHELMFSIEV